MGDDQSDGRGPSGRPRTSGWYTAAANASLGIEMGLSVAIGWLAGSWLDKRLGTEPWLTMLLLLCGIAAAFRAVIRVGRQAQRAMRRREAEQDSDDGSGG